MYCPDIVYLSNILILFRPDLCIQIRENVSETMAQQDRTFHQRQSLLPVVGSSLKTMISIYESSLQIIQDQRMIIRNLKTELHKTRQELEQFKEMSKELAKRSVPTSSLLRTPVLPIPLQSSKNGYMSHKNQPHTTSSQPGKQYTEHN